ncbi:MAG: ornithine carbamoyltransferase [Myxococcota bacterium]
MLSYLTELDRDPVWTLELLEEAATLKRHKTASSELLGRSVALYFEKPSVRTRVSFALGVQQLGGWVVELAASNTKVGKGEHPEDFASVLGRYVDLIIARVFDQTTLEIFRDASGVPVVNALSDSRHPCQALADALTIRERNKPFESLVFAFVGEGNNVAASTGLLLASFGAEVRVATPRGFGLPDSVLHEAAALSGQVVPLTDVRDAADGADVLYTDTWVSMGQEGEAQRRAEAFRGYCVDTALLARAKPDALVMHCLPAVRGQEITREVMYGAQSAIWDQAENRLHVQKALMLRILGGR